MKHSLVIALILILSTHVSAQKPRRWTRLKGPNMGSLSHTLMYDENRNILAINVGGYYLTSDNGNTWNYHSVFTGALCEPNVGGVSGLVISPSGDYYFYFAS